VVVLLEWLEKNYKTAVGGLAVVVLLLAAAFASSRSTASREIAGLNEARTSLEKELEEARGRVAELEKSGNTSNTEITALTESNEKLVERVASLSEDLTSADKKIASLRDSVDIRRKAMANMRADIAELKEEARESAKETAALNEAKTSLEKELEEARERIEALEKIGTHNTEDALPSPQSSSEAFGTAILKLSGLEFFGTIASELKEAVPAISDIAKNKEIGEFLSDLAVYEDFFGAVRDVAVLLEMNWDPELYVSFLADAAKFGDFVSRDSSLYSFEPWREKGVGHYILRAAGNDEKIVFYVAARPAGADSLVFMATKADSVSRMTDAYEGALPRFETERHTSGENFFQVKLKDGIKYHDIGSLMWNLPELANLWNSTPDKVYWSVIEKSWTQEGGDIAGETYSDMFERNPEMLPPRPENVLKSDIYGDGNLAFYASANFGLMLNMILPGATNLTPEILAFVDAHASFPFISNENIKDLLRGGKLSFVCVEKDGRVSAAYAALDTNILNAANTLYRLASLLFGGLGGRADIAGWDSAVSVPVPMPWDDSWLPHNLVIAEKRGAFLVGLGDAESFGKTLDISADYPDYVNAENIGEFVISPKIFDLAINHLNYLGSQKQDLPPEKARMIDFLTRSMTGARDSFAFLGGGVRPSGHGYVKLTMREGKDPIKSLIGDVFIPYIELAAAEMDIADDRSKAIQIINDLINLKTAALSYYGDNTEWPAQADVRELDNYSDSPIVSDGRYERVIIGDEYADGSGGKRVNIGVKLSSGDSARPGILRSLADMADKAGLLESAGGLDSYGGSSPEVYMNIR
jgi:hypothetical protein